jgi:hypothetical protein
VKVDQVALSETEGGHRLSARVRPDGADEFELWFEIPQPFGRDDGDATPFLCALLPPALIRGEPLEVDGPVSPKVLAALDDVMRVYDSFYPAKMKPITVRADTTAVPEAGLDTTVCYFSRGVDSWHSVFMELQTPAEPPLTHLVYIRGVDVLFDERQAERALEAARDAAAVAGLELAACATNMRAHSEPIMDWDAIHGAVLAGLGHVLRASRVLTSSNYAFGELIPTGSHHVLDHRYSSEVTRIEVSGEATRIEKVARLATWPEAVERIRVCLDGNCIVNCCDCSKCVHTMVELHLAGVDPRTASFDRPLTPARAASVRMRPSGLPIYKDVLARLRARPQDAELAAGFALGLRRLETRIAAEALVDVNAKAAAKVYEAADLLDAQALAPRRVVDDGAVGVVRAVDQRRRRHVYGYGWAPEGAELAGELGSLLAFRQDDSVPVWVDAEGRLVSDRTPAPGHAEPSPAARARFVGAPFGWKDTVPAGSRIRAVRQRAHLAARPKRPAAPRFAGAPVSTGYIYRVDAPGRLPLYVAYHPVTGDQLLTHSPLEASDMGYGDAELMGYLLDRAPVTGTVGIHRRPEVPWASRVGQRVRPLMQAPGMS